MKKKVLPVLAFATMVTLGVLAFTANIKEAKAEINPKCPNGCINQVAFCYCYKWYWLKEYDHKDLPTYDF
ncbi:MAG: hypothetical protein PHD06_04385 [Bacteroidales bacterium]|jgi:hypothetical protein|nr:hypothetical protein [Bacteroidales bacterium]MDY0197767.1 hypothetical protein [Tenuifilaceae bacterium]